MQDWVRLKNGNAGESLLLTAKRNRQAQQLQQQLGEAQDEDELFGDSLPSTFSGPIPIPGLPPSMTGFILHGVLTKEECQELINVMPHEGKGFMGIDQVKELYRGRIVSRFVSFDEEFSQLMEKRIRSFIPDMIDGLAYSGFSPEWRFLHYEVGGHQDAHIDGREKRGNQVESRLTLQMYLNDCGSDYEGGEMVFYDDNMNDKLRLQPKAGDCCIFYQESMRDAKDLYLVHEAERVSLGHKFAARTVIESQLSSKK